MSKSNQNFNMDIDTNDESDTYSNYSETQTDTDSSTSTTSYEVHDYVDEAQVVETAATMKNILREQLVQPIMGKPFKPLFSENEIDDSFELSLLRFIHLVFSVDGVINFDNLTTHMDMSNPNCIKLYEYFMNNPGIMNDYSFYYSNAGVDLRTKWVELLANINSFTYKGNNQEIDPVMENLFEFFEQFFPKLNQDGYTIQQKLTNMYDQLNFNFETFEVVQSSYQKIVVNSLHHGILQNIRINGIDMYVWEMTKLKDISSGNPVELFSDSEFRYA
jgi:hypothetical protein